MRRRITDPDETEGRALYRAMASRDARTSLGLARRVRLLADGEDRVPSSTTAADEATRSEGASGK